MGPLLNNLCHHTSPHSPAAFSKSKPETLFNSNVEHKLNSEGSIIPRHNKFLPLGEGDGSGHVACSDVHLRLVVCDKRFVSSTLFLFQNVNLQRKKTMWSKREEERKASMGRTHRVFARLSVLPFFLSLQTPSTQAGHFLFSLPKIVRCFKDIL